MIITIGSTKGGVGKSTIACNLAVAAARDKKSTLLIDADIQASSMAFRAARETDDIKAVAITTPTLHKDLNQFSMDFIFIDAGGRDTGTFRSAIMAADMLIIPCLPSSVDFWAAGDVIEVLREARAYKDIKACFLLNQVIPNTRLSKEAVDAMQEYNADAKLLKTSVHSRIVYKNAFAMGRGVLEMRDVKATEEIKGLYSEVKRFNGGKK